MDIDLVKELKKREILNNLVDEIIESSVTRDSRKRVRRGIMHTLVASSLGVQNSSRLRTLVNSRMVHLGYPMTISAGKRFYSGLELKKEVSLNLKK